MIVEGTVHARHPLQRLFTYRSFRVWKFQDLRHPPRHRRTNIRTQTINLSDTHNRTILLAYDPQLQPNHKFAATQY